VRILLALTLGALAAPIAAAAPATAPAARPAQEPAIAPVPDWVQPVAAGSPDPALADRAAQVLLSNTQSLYAADHSEHYTRIAFLVQNVQAMQGLGTITLPWNPESSELVIHRVQIVRGGRAIDLLAGGHRFTVLRRENNLESAMLDGTLTAVMQADGLAVGDILDISWTVRRRGGALPQRAENVFQFGAAQPIRRLAIRQIWPASLPVRWRGTGAFDHPQTRTTARGTELSVDLSDAVLPQPPAQLPVRLQTPSRLEISQFRDWAEISDMMASHYREAARIAPDGPLAAEIARIAASSQDPAVRTMAALRLVQDQVRYFALVMGDGNYLPAAAEQSWTRRYADCKGKAVLLVSLLQGLGIEAEPVVVNADGGDGFDDRLPMLNMFNHVIVRARIGGRFYWLDGTHSGDRSLEDLAVSTLGWGLPIRAGGAALEALPFGAPPRPIEESNTTYDGSHGLTGAIPARTEFVMRGDTAVQMRQAVAGLGREAFLSAMREQMSANTPAGFTFGAVDLRDDPEDGAFTLIVTGQRTIEWGPVPGTAPANGPRRMQFEQELPSLELGSLRPDGPFHDSPVALPVPYHALATETVILPNGGRGFTVDGGDIERVVTGTRFTRRLSIADGRVTARWEATRIAREISAADARASTAQLRQLRDDKAYLRAAPGAIGRVRAARGTVVRPANDGASSAAAGEPSSAQEFNRRGYERLQGQDLDGADSDFERAVALRPEWSRPIANRAIVLIHRGKYDEAETLLGRAAELDANDFVVHQGRGLVHMARHRPIQAIVEYSRALEIEPRNAFTLFQRVAAYQQVGEFDGALADLNEILAGQPDNRQALTARARQHAWRGAGDLAAADMDAIVAQDPRDPARLYQRAEMLRRIGRAEAAGAGFAEALAALDARAAAAATGGDDGDRALRQAILAASGRTAGAIALLDSQLAGHANDATLLNDRCWTRATANVELAEALADCERAVARSPNNPAILDSRAFVKLRMGQYEAAIADEDAALSHAPDLPAALYTRGIARLRKGDREAGERDLAAARRLVYDIDARYRDYGVTP
jgi:tetratricopeptide (TPR) repeat protein